MGHLRDDARALTAQEPTWLRKIAVLCLNPGFHAVLLYRVSRWLHLHHLSPLGFIVSYVCSAMTGAQISRRAAIGRRLVICHPFGIVIGAGSVIGDHCTLVGLNYIGQRNFTGVRPVIGSHLHAGVGAKLLGDIRVGDRVHLGADVVVTESLPDDVTIAGGVLRHRGIAADRSPAA